MADATDSDSPQDPSSHPDRDRDWYAKHWARLSDELGTADPTEALARVQALKREVKQRQSPDAASDDEGLVTVSEVEEVFREMNEKMEKLRERNAALVEQLEEGDDEIEGPFRDLHQKAEQLLDTLDAATMDEARGRIQKLNQRLEDLYQEKEQLAEAGLSDAEAALAELDRLREERDALQQERDRLQADRDELEQKLQDSSSGDTVAPDTSTLEAATVIRDQIGIETPEQAEAFTRIVNQLYEHVQSRAAAHDVAADDAPDDVVETLHSISAHIDALPHPNALPAAAAAALGVSTASEARTLAETVRRIGARIVERYKGTVEFEEVAPESDDALSLLHTLEDQLRALPDDLSADDEDALPAEISEVLGIRTVEDARELESLITDLSERLDRLSQEHEKLDEADLSVDAALTMIENMESQLVDLYHGSASLNGTSALDTLDDTLREDVFTLIDPDPDEVDDITQVVRRLTDRLDRVTDDHETLTEIDLGADEAVAMIESMESQLKDLYQKQNEQTEAAERLAAIEDVLGISTRAEAEELSQIARQMEEQLTTVYKEKQKLEELGLSSIEDAVDMVQNMEDQLIELYEDKEALQEVRLGSTEEQSTFQQLEALYAERERLQQALGVSSATDIIELVESLNTQLDELYKSRDADIDPEERHDTQLWAPEADPDAEASTEEPRPTDDDTALPLNSMEHQLEALYREKETLLHHGLDNAQEAVTQLQTQQKQLDALQRENHIYEQRFDRLQAELGTANVSRIVALVQSLQSEAGVALEDIRPAFPETDDDPEYGLDIEATSPFVDADTLRRLGDMSADERDALDVGVVRLRDDGTVEALNEAALQLPGLSSIEDRTTVIGKNFFLELAPSTNNNLFYGRFQEGKQRGAIDARFPYTFTSLGEEPQSFAVHLYRTPDSDATWLLYRPT